MTDFCEAKKYVHIHKNVGVDGTLSDCQDEL